MSVRKKNKPVVSTKANSKCFSRLSVVLAVRFEKVKHTTATERNVGEQTFCFLSIHTFNQAVFFLILVVRHGRRCQIAFDSETNHFASCVLEQTTKKHPLHKATNRASHKKFAAGVACNFCYNAAM